MSLPESPPGRRSGPGLGTRAARGASLANDTTTVTDSSDRTGQGAVCGVCRWRGHIFPDGQRRCPEHTSEADVALLEELDERAAVVGLTRTRWAWDDVYAYPYGPNVHLDMRARMLDWARDNGLQLVDRHHRCVAWVRTGGCRSITCRTSLASAWLDHVTCWSRNGAPAVLVAQPYHLSGQSVEELAGLDADPQLRVEVSRDSWYGLGTWMVGVWREGA